MTRVGLDALLARSDLLSLHLPLTAATRHILDRRAIARMKPGAIVINTARGGLIDEAALHEALVDGRLGGAGLDVFEREPPGPDNPLLALRTKMRALFANVERFYRGDALSHRVDLG